MLLQKTGLIHITSVRHEGKVVVLGIDSAAKIFYTVKREGFEEDLAGKTDALKEWEDWTGLELPSPQDGPEDSSVVRKEREELRVDTSDPAKGPQPTWVRTALQSGTEALVYRSRYDTADQTELGPVQALSAMGHLYVFRQSKSDATKVLPNCALVDRFVLDGLTNKLVRKLDVRYKRSRLKHEPKNDGKGSKTTFDALDFKDANGRPFFEPTTELTFLAGITSGFAVVVTPGKQLNQFRWHFFSTAFEPPTGNLREVTRPGILITSVKASDEGLFALADTDDSPSIVQRLIPFRDSITEVQTLEVFGTPAVTVFDRQIEASGPEGPQLIRAGVRVMATIRTDPGILALTFDVMGDGSLALADEQMTPTATTLRADSKEVSLPSLERVLALARRDPVVGIIKAISREADGRARITAIPSNGTLSPGAKIVIGETSNYNGEFAATRVSAGRLAQAISGPTTTLRLAQPLTERIDKGTFLTITTRTVEGPGAAVTTATQILEVNADAAVSATTVTVKSFSAGTTPAGTEIFLRDALIVDANFTSSEFGFFREVIPPPDNRAAEGAIAAVSLVPGSRLKMDVPGHITREGELVEVRNSIDLAGVHTVDKIDGTQMVLASNWRSGLVRQVGTTQRRGLEFAGPEDRVFSTLGNEFTVNGDFTIEAWVRPRAGRGTILTLGAIPAGRPEGPKLQLFYTPESVFFSVAGGQLPAGTPVGLSLNEFRHIAVTYEKAGARCRMFLDGGSAGERTLTVPELGNLTLLLGSGDRGSFQGTLSDVRLWNRARTQSEIFAAMSASLTGREQGLEGYWRLNAIAEGTPRTVADFGPLRAHGVVEGSPFVTELALARKLRDGRPAFAYELDDMVNVIGGATYIESFEYRLNPASPAPPANLFRFRYFGKRRRSEDDVVSISGSAVTASIDVRGPDGNGFRLATAAVRIPSDVTLLRAFAVEDLQGDWTSIEIRRHRLQLVTNSITQHSFEEAVTPQRLDFGGSQELVSLYEQAAQLEETEALLVSVDRDSVPQRLTDLRVERGRLELDVILSLPVSVQFTRTVGAEPDAHLDIDNGNSALLDLIPGTTVKLSGVFTFKKVRLLNDPSRLQEAYFIFCDFIRQSDRTRLTGQLIKSKDDERFGFARFFQNVPDVVDRLQSIEARPAEQIGRLLFDIRRTDGREGRVHTTIRNVGTNRFFMVHEDGSGRDRFGTSKPTPGTPPTGFILTAVSQQFTNATGPLQQRRLEDVRRQITRFEGFESLPQLSAVQPILADVRSQIATRFPQASQQAVTVNDQAVDCVHLSSVEPQGGNLHLLETVEGEVLLSYAEELPALPDNVLALTGPTDQLREGTFLRQIRYDAKTAAWKPYNFRRCLNVSGTRRLLLDHPVPLSTDWTIEFWFFHPSFPEADDSGIGICKLVDFGDGRSIGFANGFLLVLTAGGIPLEPGLTLENVAPGWHHLAIVARDQQPPPESPVDGATPSERSNLEFFLDGGSSTGNLRKTLKAGLPPGQGLPVELGQFGGSISSIGRAAESTSRPIGRVAEFRVWRGALSLEEIEANMVFPATGNEPDLIAYYPLNGDVIDATGSGNDGFVAKGSPEDALPFPTPGARLAKTTGGSAVTAAEYTTFAVDPDTGARTAMMRRFTGVMDAFGARLVSDKRVEELELRFIGNAQFKPTLLGYIEGAPPVPSENLTVTPDAYAGATSVATVQATDVEFSWNRSKESSGGASFDFFAGLDLQVDQGFAFGGFLAFEGLAAKVGLKGNVNIATGTQEGSTVSASTSTLETNRLELRGSAETEPAFPVLGPRFVPKNVGYALVISALADVFIARLKKTRRMVEYQVLPVPNIPPDVNTLTFFINPAYTLNGSLDGMVGSAAATDRFHREVPSMRAQYGSLLPASYFRLREAVDLKLQIQAQDARRASYFENFDARLAFDFSESADRAIASRIDNPQFDPAAVTVRPDGQGGKSADEQKLDDLQSKVNALKSEFASRQDQLKSQLELKSAEVALQLLDPQKQSRALLGFAAWQKRLEDLQIRAGKRNIVNTYVWDADGGLHSEAQEFASTVEHTIGSSISFEGALGAAAEIAVGAAAFEFTGQGTFSMTQTLSKTERTGASLSLEVDLSGIESNGVTDAHGRPITPGEKVNRFRFNTFYLEKSKQNFDDFFAYVVDPEWLASNDEQARALRQVDRAKKNEVWRVLHRVTSVERPALSGFGNDVRPVVTNAAATATLEQQVTALLEANAELKQKLEDLSTAVRAKAAAAGA